MGNGATYIKSGMGPGASGIIITNGGLDTLGRGICVVLGGPEKFVAAVDSRVSEGYITRLMDSVSTEVCPINELSHRDRNLLLVAGSNRFTGTLARPSVRIPGACHIAVRPSLSGRRETTLRGNIRVSNGVALPSRIHIISHRRNHIIVRLAVFRNEGHRVEGVYRDLKLRITELGHVGVNSMGLKVLGANSCHRLAPSRIRTLVASTRRDNGLEHNLGSGV